jgi:hypothetical protein
MNEIATGSIALFPTRTIARKWQYARRTGAYRGGLSCRFLSRVTVPLLRGQERRADIRSIAWRGQLRLNHRCRKFKACCVHRIKISVAITFELAGFLWSIG